MPFDSDIDQKILSLQSAWEGLPLNTMDKAELTARQWAAIARHDRKQPIIVGQFKQDVQDLIEFASVCVDDGALCYGDDHPILLSSRREMTDDLLAIDECLFGDRTLSKITFQYGFYEDARTRYLHADGAVYRDTSLYIARFGQFATEFIDYEALRAGEKDCDNFLAAAREYKKDSENALRALKTKGILKEINLGAVALLEAGPFYMPTYHEQRPGSEHCSAYVPPPDPYLGNRNHSAFLRACIHPAMQKGNRNLPVQNL